MVKYIRLCLSIFGNIILILKNIINKGDLLWSGKKIAVVTGASSGLGKEFVKIFIKNRNLDEVWAIARNKDNLIKLKEEYGNNIKLFSVD